MKSAGAIIFIFLSTMLLSCQNNDPNDINWKSFIDSQIEFAVDQYKGMDKILPDSLTPRTYENNEFITAGTSWWCSGFYPGSLWYLYEFTGDENLKEIAHRRTMVLEPEKHNRGTHDLGFMLYNSFGQGWRITGKKEYKDILLTGAESLISRYNENVGCIRSWDHREWEFPVIIDNMMNLEYLFWASKTAENQDYYNKCVSHAEKSLENHYRPDHSSFHLVDFDTLTGEVLVKQTVQGFSDESAWARGQTWGLYGFITVYRDTRNEKYLEHAKAVASFILDHPNYPEDGIPYWDFNAPDIPAAKRDASAGAIMASALLELSGYVNEKDSAIYVDASKKILYNLAADYRASEVGDNGFFILKHSVGHLPGDSEVDVPLTYADYYFIEALMRLREKI
jgi:hypothetical protein